VTGAVLAALVGCRAAGVAPADRARLLACLGAPPEALYQPERLAAAPARGLSVHSFEQQTAGCGPVERRYLSYVPPTLGARTEAPVLLVLHGQGASAEAMMTFQTHGTFNALADRQGLVVVYGNGLPTSFNISGLANSGRWRTDDTPPAPPSVDDVDYLRRVVDDLAARGVIAGGNEVYLVGQSNGGGMALRAARARPDAYAGVAAFMPFVGFSPAAPESLAGARLRRVLFVYSTEDPGLPPGYADAVLAPLVRGWARALGVPERDVDAQVVSSLAVTVTELDLAAGRTALRALVLDRAGHFWPTRNRQADPAPLRAQFGLRNQDIEGADEVWRFFGE
jgi:poly(3-hydroxybutyrate) depolymerase